MMPGIASARETPAGFADQIKNLPQAVATSDF